MSVKTISKDELRRMEGSEGLIIQGCGGSLDEWVDGINDMLTEDGILLDGTRFHDCSTFEPVSYTHLDVYKRQAINRGVEQFGSSSGS